MISVAISAGGKSSRMGTDKAFVDVMGRPMIEHVLERIDGLGPLFLITNRPEQYAHLGLPMVQDIIPDKGPLGGIYTALYHSSAQHTLVIATDMPFVSRKLLDYMISLVNDTTDIVVPRVEKYPQALLAIYSKACLAPVRERIEQNRLKAIGFYPKVRVRYIDEDEYHSYDEHGLTFFNINTPEELEEARLIAEGSL